MGHTNERASRATRLDPLFPAMFAVRLPRLGGARLANVIHLVPDQPGGLCRCCGRSVADLERVIGQGFTDAPLSVTCNAHLFQFRDFTVDQRRAPCS